jgi:hypothetical protein
MNMIPQQKQYTKFEYKEFGNLADKHFVVHIPESVIKNENEIAKDRIINDVITEHFTDNAPIITDISDFVPKEEKNTPIAPIIDLEAMKMESYKKGYEDAKIALEPELKLIREDDIFHSLIKEKLEAISPVIDIKDQTFTLVTDLLSVMAKKLHLMLPADFESIILGEMVPLLSKYYKIGTITLNVNPERVDYCKNLFRIGSLPNNISENIIVNADEFVARDSCNLNWNDTLLEYNQEELILDIEKILEHLKIEVNH